MDVEKDLEYAEIMELSTIPLHSSTVEAQFATYVNVANILRPDVEPIADNTKCTSSTSRKTTFKRFSSIDETDVDHYENVLASSMPIPDKTPSTNQILPSNPEESIGYGGCLIQDDVLSLRTRLRIKKQRLPFKEFCVYAMKDVFEEVERIMCLDIVFLAFSVMLTTLGCIRIDSCKMSKKIPVMMVVCGILDSLANLCSIISSSGCKTHRECHQMLRDLCRIDRILMFFMHAYSLILIYLIIPPDEKDHASPDYCDALIFWAAFCYFHITVVTSIFIWIGMLAAAASYFL